MDGFQISELTTWLLNHKEILGVVALVIGLLSTLVFKPVMSICRYLVVLIVRMRKKRTVYISAPISNNDDKSGYASVIKAVRRKTLSSNISAFSAYDDYVDEGKSHSFHSVANSTIYLRVYKQLKSCTDFVLIWGEKNASSCLVETGVALAQGKNIVIIHVEGTLPWTLHPTTIGNYSSSVTFLSANSLNDLAEIVDSTDIDLWK